MIGENILEDTHPENTEFANCKIKYLLAENKLMSVQLASVSTLVEKYKEIIDILSKQNLNAAEQGDAKQAQKIVGKVQLVDPKINKILKDSDQIIYKCIQECKSISNNKNIFEDEEGTITPAFFAELVLSYEKTIAELKHSIHQREILLQQLQTTPNHPMKRSQVQAQSSTIIKAIQSYDIYPKISEKCRREILELKQRKKKIELGLASRATSNYGKKMTSNSFSEVDKTIKKGTNMGNNQANAEEKTQVQIDSMSPFEKTILIYKKKKIFNDILEAKVIDLKKKIKEKGICNQILKKRLENQVWDNIENINHHGRNLDDDDPAYLSMLNQSIRVNNLDFSVDISRVVPGAVKEHVNVNNILKEVEEKQPI